MKIMQGQYILILLTVSLFCLGISHQQTKIVQFQPLSLWVNDLPSRPSLLVPFWVCFMFDYEDSDDMPACLPKSQIERLNHACTLLRSDRKFSMTKAKTMLSADCLQIFRNKKAKLCLTELLRCFSLRIPPFNIFISLQSPLPQWTMFSFIPSSICINKIDDQSAEWINL